MATIARDDDFAVAGRESMVEPSMRRGPGVHGRAAHATTSANTHGLGLISTNRGGTKRYYHFDGLGTTWALTSGSGTVTDTYSYTAFGVLLSSTGSSVNPSRFVGQWGYYDDGARGSGYGLMLVDAGVYAPIFGGFLSRSVAIERRAHTFDDNSGVRKLCIIMCDDLICAGLSKIKLDICKKACENLWCKQFGRGDYKPFYRKCWKLGQDAGDPEVCSDCCERVCSPLPEGAQKQLCLKNCNSGCGA